MAEQANAPPPLLVVHAGCPTAAAAVVVALQVLTEDISPALDKLRGEKVQYMEWNKMQQSLDRLRRYCVAYRYVEAER